MEMNEYQRRAIETCMPSCNNYSYMMLNLVGEVGELAGKVAKAIRKEKAYILDNQLITERGLNALTVEEMNDIKSEAGDVIWQIAGLCHVMGWAFDDVAKNNLAKLADRKNRGVIAGNGDRR